MNAKEISDALYRVAFLLELDNENEFRVRAFDSAARVLGDVTEPIEDFIARCKTQKVKGIGPQIFEAVEAMYERGRLPVLEELEAKFPAGIFELYEIPGLGPKKIKALYTQLNVVDVNGLQAACENGSLLKLKGFSDKTAVKLLNAVKDFRVFRAQTLFPVAAARAEMLRVLLADSGVCSRVELSGEIRRGLPVVNGIELLLESSEPDACFDYLLGKESVASVLERTADRLSVALASGEQVKLHVTSKSEFVSAWVEETGNTEYWAALSKKASKGKACSNESEYFSARGVQLIPAECRERAGYVDLKAAPRLLERKDLKGILHAHSSYSDGKHTLREMALAVRDRGLEYFGISDHSQSAVYAGGLREDKIRKQHAEIDQLNAELAPFRIFKGIESDILADGALDYPPEILALFDFIIVSVHSLFSQPEAVMTERMLAAIRNPYTSILAHPTGRLLLKRNGYQVNVGALIEAAAEAGVAIEINANPRRLDIDWSYLERARKLGVSLPVNPDAHSITQLDYVDHGVRVARKGLLGPEHVLNCLGRDAIEQHFLKKKPK